MNDTLSLSLNELRALFQRVVEAKWGRRYDSFALAEILTWMETHQFDGLAIAREIATTEKDSSAGEIDRVPEYLLTTPVYDLAIGGAMANRIIETTLTGMTNAGLILSGLARCGQSKQCAMIFSNATKDTLASISKGADFPSHRFNRHTPIQATEELVLVCSADMEKIKTRCEELSISIECDALSTPFDFANQKNDALDNGIEMQRSDYQRLTVFASQTLVPTSEKSRVGAGD